jgi:hypothetical protein
MVSDFLDKLILKSTGALPGIAPRPASAYEPLHGHPQIRMTEHPVEHDAVSDASRSTSRPHPGGAHQIISDIDPSVRRAVRVVRAVPNDTEVGLREAGQQILSERGTIAGVPADQREESIPIVRPARNDVQPRNTEAVAKSRQAPLETPMAEEAERPAAITFRSEDTETPKPQKPRDPAQQPPANTILREFSERVEAQSGLRNSAERHRAVDLLQGSEQTMPRTIKVTIGRIDVRANFEAPVKTKRAESARSTMSLDEYLKKRGSR